MVQVTVQAYGLIYTPLTPPLGFPGGSAVKNLPAMQEIRVDTGSVLEKEIATHTSILAWEIPWTQEPGGATVHGVTKSET